jgi:acyl-CoA thioester hydrolase
MPAPSSPGPPAFDLSQRATFRHFAPITIRYADLDPVGHVNNVAIAAYIEQGRTSLIGPLLRESHAGGLDTVLARVVIDYLAELDFPGSIEVGTRIVKVGTKSIVAGHGVFQGERCHATAECVIVFFDLAARRAAEPPPPLKARLLQLMAGEG